MKRQQQAEIAQFSTAAGVLLIRRTIRTPRHHFKVPDKLNANAILAASCSNSNVARLGYSGQVALVAVQKPSLYRA